MAIEIDNDQNQLGGVIVPGDPTKNYMEVIGTLAIIRDGLATDPTSNRYDKAQLRLRQGDTEVRITEKGMSTFFHTDPWTFDPEDRLSYYQDGAVGTRSGFSFYGNYDVDGIFDLSIARIYISADPSYGSQLFFTTEGRLGFNQDFPAAGAVSDASRTAQEARSAALVSAASVETNAAAASLFTLTLAQNATLAAPSNLKAGEIMTWKITQDGTGNRTLAYASAFKFPGGTVPTLSTAAGAVDVLHGVSDGTNVYVELKKAFA
jgi:hypothetical protein